MAITRLKPTGVNTAASFTMANLTVTGNVTTGNAVLGNLATSNYFSGNGSLLTAIASAGTVTTNAQPNITSVGTLASISTTGLISMQQSTESVATPSGSTYNFNNGAVFYTTSATAGANFTPNFTNMPTTDNKVTLVSIIINQDTTPYLPTATANIQIDGANYAVKWSGGTAPTSRASAIQTFTFSLLRTGATWYVTGSSGSYY